MAGSDSEEFESADEEYEYKEQKNPLKKNTDKIEVVKQLDTENISTKDGLTNKEVKQTVDSELNTENEKQCYNTIEVKTQELDVSEDGWDDFGDDEWIDTIPETNKIDINETQQNNSSSDPLFNKPVIESFNKNCADEAEQVAIVTERNNKIDLSKQEERNSSNTHIENNPTISDSITANNQNTEATSSWGVWKPWGGIVSSVFTAASEGVTTITTFIESGIGAPDPETLVKINKEKNNINIENVRDDQSIKSNKNQDGIPSLGNLVSGVTNIGNKVITGGLDTLEGIGKKTMNILQENDPLLLQKRKFMGLESERPILSQVLREAKAKSEEVEKNLKQMQKQAYKKQLHFESLFDNYYGLVHLEALEMLSKQAAIKLQSLLDPLTGKALTELKETLNEVNELCDLGDLDVNDTEEPLACEDLKEKLESSIEDLGVEISFEEILKCWKKNTDELDNNLEPHHIYEKGLRCLAETCALQINKMHKIAELLIIKEHHSTANEADSLVQMTTIFCYHLHGIANKFCRKLNTLEQNEELSSLITNLFLEVCNSTSYVQSAFKLFIPILQVGAA